MITPADLKKLHDTCVAQAQQLTTIVHPQTILKHGYPPPDKMFVMLADSMGLALYAQAAILEILVELTQPKVVQ